MPAECHKCGKYFDFGNYKVDEHSLRQHMQVKRLIYICTRTPGRSAPIFSSVSLRSKNGSTLKLKPKVQKKTLVLVLSPDFSPFA